MPKYSYETYSDMKSTSNQKKERKVGYFKLKPGEKAIVRFVYATPKEFEITTIHEVKVKDKVRSVVCLRSAKDPLDACPLCANGTPIKARFFVKLLHYVQDETGKVVQVSPEVANFQKKYADILSARFNEYGDLCNNLFTITRIGSGVETSYDIQYANPMKYTEANGYVKDFSAFEDFDLAHHSYTERSKEDIEEFLQSGEFPMPKRNQNNSTLTTREDGIQVGGAPVFNSVEEERQVEQALSPTPAPKYDDMPSPTVQQPQQPQQSSDDFTFARPRRTYDIQ